MSMRVRRIVAVAGGLFFLAPGIWAMADPRSFFDRLATFEPYNQHFIQDIGALQVGIGAVLLLAALRPALGVLSTTLIGSGIGAAAHTLSHVIGRDLGGHPETDIPMFGFVAAVLHVAGLWSRDG
jgi:hypothetical protein